MKKKLYNSDIYHLGLLSILMLIFFSYSLLWIIMKSLTVLLRQFVLNLLERYIIACYYFNVGCQFIFWYKVIAFISDKYSCI